MNIEEVRRVVGKIKTTLFKNSNSYSIGMFKSHFRGTGLMFREHQVYNHGDDVRFIDWKLLAKTSHPYIKTFEEERNVEIVVIIDASPTMFTGYKNVSKLQAAIEITCLLYLLAKETGDLVHAIVCGREIIDCRKMNGERGIIEFISNLRRQGLINENGKINLAYKHKEDIDSAIRFNTIMRHFQRKKEVVLLTDFNDFVDKSQINKMLYRNHVHCFRLVSPLDEAEKIPYLLYFKKKIVSKKGWIGKIKFQRDDEREEVRGKRIKTLRVSERYLEEFIKEML